ncbi:hypothetical protein MANES_13G102850v8 [Manihot esculenta]|uniref:Uncharacterized protein n=1 Tax=Manihot esculenta TaxID=3983 RepID=A0ACB7GM91_MANES|nr:hypothetical protein MANES_13G102850v8 [Manihot esculenta]
MHACRHYNAARLVINHRFPIRRHNEVLFSVSVLWITWMHIVSSEFLFIVTEDIEYKQQLTHQLLEFNYVNLKNRYVSILFVFFKRK